MPFLTTYVDSRTRDFRNFELLTNIDYLTKDGRTIRAPIGTSTDLFSTPQAIWNLIPPSGPMDCVCAFCAIIHDAEIPREASTGGR